MENEKKLNRESLLSGEMHKLAASRLGDMRLMTDAERVQMVEETIASAPDQNDFRVFAYGSLIWNPILEFDIKTRCVIDGYYRSFCFWTKFGRGSEQQPGLMMGLEPGGTCEGIAYRIPKERLFAELDILFRREMLSFVYKPTWIQAISVDQPSDNFPTLAFVVDEENKRYCGKLDQHTVVKTLALAEGPLGNNRDYLFQLVDHLEQLGFEDQTMSTLAEEVRQYRSIIDSKTRDN